MKKNELNSVEVKSLLNYFIPHNVELAKKGKMPIALEIEGMPGTAKTSVVKQVAAEMNLHFVRLNLSEIEVCDLIGLPIYECKVTKGKDEKWVIDKSLPTMVSGGWAATGENRTSYAKPSWIHGKEDKPIILLLDDYNRTTPMMTNACMTIIDEQKYNSWGLPLGSTVILTCNPSDQDFMVQSEDSAQATRRLKINMKASVDTWASEFAEPYGVDSRCINFMLKHPEIIEGAIVKDKNGQTLAKGNLRIWTKFFDSISGISDFNKDISLINNLGSGSLPMEHVVLFSTFIRQGLDKLPTPQELLAQDVDKTIKDLKKVIGEGSDRRQDIAAIMTKRLLNYAIVHEANYTPKMVNTYAEIMESGLLSVDLVVISLNTLCSMPKFKHYPLRDTLMDIMTGK